jgi:ABC-type multidrug transport system fused ATPase/permease subunit
MKHSRSKGRKCLAALAFVALDLVARLSLPAALLALTHGRVTSAVAASAAVTVASWLRSLLFGWSMERSLVDNFHRLVSAARRTSPPALKNRPEALEGLPALLNAVRENASVEAQSRPQLVSLAIALLAVIAAVAAFLGPRWLLIGAAVALVVGLIAAIGQRNGRSSGQQAYRRFGEVTRDMGVLFEASVELRAHDREGALRADLATRVDAMARHERQMATWSALTGLFPAGVALLAVAVPARSIALLALKDPGGPPMAELGILGSTGLVIAFGFVRLLEDMTRSRPYRRALAAFIARAEAEEAEQGVNAGPLRGGVTPPALDQAEIRFEGVTCVHPGAPCATPVSVTYHWASPGGLALSGANGAGKSTLALALLGLITPAEGRITVGGVPLAEIDLERYRQRIVYIPQGAYTALSEPVSFHLRLLSARALSDAAIDAALAKVGLLPALEGHALRGGGAPREVLAGELSGGERQRMHLARAFLHDAELVLLDEPEVGLDAAGRGVLRALLEELAARRRVLVIAHDEAILPPSFARLRCARGPATRGDARQAREREGHSHAPQAG